jgi:hypothetical protein
VLAGSGGQGFLLHMLGDGDYTVTCLDEDEFGPGGYRFFTA